MNWKSTPHLFANGKFSFKLRRNNNIIKITSFYDIREKHKNDKAIGFNNLFRLDEIEGIIARPIEDLADEEIPKVLETDVYSNEYARELLKERLQKGTLLGYHERNLLSIGVYPFSDTEDVIFKPKP